MEDYEIEEGFSGNMPCDDSGFCAGTSCPQYFLCHGKEQNKEVQENG